MGYHIHHTIVVTSWNDKMIVESHNKAVEIFKDCVSEIVRGFINSQGSFFIAPDGSKEGWPESDKFDLKRKEFKLWMNKNNNYCDWVELAFGGDEPEKNTGLIAVGHYRELEDNETG